MEKLDVALSEVAKTLKQAIDKYGPDAVDLALVAYRVDAIQTLVFGFAWAAVTFALFKIGQRVLQVTEKDYQNGEEWAIFARVFGVGLPAVAGILTSLGALNDLLDVPAWVAALGYPELMIATRALEAAGLL